MKFGLKEIRIEMGMFDFSVLCIVGHRKNVDKYIRWKYNDPNFDSGEHNQRGFCFARKGYVPVIWIPRKPKTPREYATLAHECIHAVWDLFVWADMPISRDTEEVMTHATAHLITTILNKLK